MIAIPNVTKHSKSIDEKGCEAYVKMVEGQVQAYKMDKKSVPTLTALTADGYLPDNPACPNGNAITITGDGKVTATNGGG